MITDVKSHYDNIIGGYEQSVKRFGLFNAGLLLSIYNGYIKDKNEEAKEITYYENAKNKKGIKEFKTIVNSHDYWVSLYNEIYDKFNKVAD